MTNSLEISEELMNNIGKKADELNNKPEEELLVCPCCGKHTLHSPVTPADELIEQFMVCSITGEPYRQTYDLYGGRAHIDVVNVTQQLAEHTTRILSILESVKDKIPTLNDNIQILQDNARIYSCIEKIIISSGAGAMFTPAKAIADICDEIEDANKKMLAGDMTVVELEHACAGWCAKATDATQISGLPRTILTSLIQIHMHVYNMLLESGLDENFWTRIKLA